MSTINEVRQLVYSRFLTAWTVGSPTPALRCPVTFDNEAFKPPTSGPWVRVGLRNVASNQHTLGQLGNRVFERHAIVFIQIFILTDKGLKEADTLAQAARAIFEGVSVGDVAFFDSSTREVGTDGLWYQVVVESVLTYNETK